jgi:hypothetical protein
MEEQKIVSKEVKMNVVKPEETKEQPQKLTYEELNQACAEMSQQLQNQGKYIQQLRQQNQAMGYSLQYKRLDYLLKIIELSFGEKRGGEYDFDSEFILKCITEVQEAMTIPEKKEESSEED